MIKYRGTPKSVTQQNLGILRYANTFWRSTLCEHVSYIMKNTSYNVT